MGNPALKSISENVRQLLGELPSGVELVAAAKGAPNEAVVEAIEAGVKIIGESYVQEAERHKQAVGNRVKWHLIGHLQKNKVRKAVALFDMIESVDSLEIAREIDRQCALIDKIMPVLIEVNSGREPQKSGVLPEAAEQLAREISNLPNLKLEGLMTIGPYSSNPEDYRSCFAATRRLLQKCRLTYGIPYERSESGLTKSFDFAPSTSLRTSQDELNKLSMGMSDSYKIAIEEGANLVRIGTRIFGERD